MEKSVRNAIASATQELRRTLEDDYRSQLDSVFDIRSTGNIAPPPGAHLSPGQIVAQSKIVAVLEYHQASGLSAAEAVQRFIRDAAFTALNRFVALRMLEARELVQECVASGPESAGYREFVGLAPGLDRLPAGHGYRIYLECLFDELSTEIKVLFDRSDTASLLWPGHTAFNKLIEVLRRDELHAIWDDDETIGWFYQFFNSKDERQQMRDESEAPRNSRELAVRNQFFTPRYVVQFLVDNTLGRMWSEMAGTSPALSKRCEYYVELDDERPERRFKDPRDLRVLDPACGSGHFLLYSFDLLSEMYVEAWELGLSDDSRTSLRDSYATIGDLQRELPRLIIEGNLHGVDIDPRAAQIAVLAVWLRSQRYWRDMGLPGPDRPRLRRTGIVIAEPMPGDAELIDEFADRLDPPLLGVLFRQIVHSMSLAGEMGTLVRVEVELADEIHRARAAFVSQRIRPLTLFGFGLDIEQGRLDLSGIDDDMFFAEAEQRLIDALTEYASQGLGARSARQKLFVEDASQGVALLGLLRERFDVVLMNPPFGDPVEGTFDWLKSSYPGFHADLYAAFFARAAELAPQGAVGAVTSRSFLVAPRLEQMRRELIATRGQLLLDLRQGVMDDAAVEAAATVLGPGDSASMLFIDASDGRRVREGINGGLIRALPRFDLPRSTISSLHQARILYRLPSALHDLLRGDDCLEPRFGTAREGPKTFDNSRFVRLRWELGPREYDHHEWLSFAKGGEYFFGVNPPHLLLNWTDNGAELRALNRAMNGSTSQVRQASKYWFRSGATYSKRSQRGFSARLLPAGTVFSSNGPAILGESPNVTPERLLAWINSLPLRALLTLQSNFADYSTGAIKRLPWPISAAEDSWALVDAAVRVVTLQMAAALRFVETSPYFCLPAALLDSDPLEGLHEALADLDTLSSEFFRASLAIDDLTWAGEVLDPASGWVDSYATLASQISSSRADIWSWAVGVAIGRFGVLAEGALELIEIDALAALPLLAPAQSMLDHESRLANHGIAVSDPGHPFDLSDAVISVLTNVQGRLDVGIVSDPLLMDTEAISAWIRTEFFESHLSKYSQSGRQAPLYWPIGTKSGRYLVWLYAHGVSADTLFQVLHDIVVPKVTLEEQRLTQLRQTAGLSPTASQRRDIDKQAGFVDELHELAQTLEAVAPLWAPDLNDGIVLVLAPLWQLFAHHRAWSRDLKTHWAKLANGDYDWAQLAMHLWPERVIPKCATDRSLAIAHNLESTFWTEDATNPDKWHPRTTRTTLTDQLITRHDNPATTAALGRFT